MATNKNQSNKVMSKLAKTILITGASTGFGRDTAETLTREGYVVFASFRDIAVRNKSHAEALRSAGINVVELDVTNNDSVERGVRNVLSQAGQIDVLVNNAGIASAGVSEADAIPALFTKTSICPAWDRTLRTPLSTESLLVTSSSTTLIPALRNASAWDLLRTAMSRKDAKTT